MDKSHFYSSLYIEMDELNERNFVNLALSSIGIYSAKYFVYCITISRTYLL